MSEAAVCAIVVNWNGWRDTIVCLESLFAQVGSSLRILVCDNASSDDSVRQLQDWLRQRWPGWVASEGPDFGLLEPTGRAEGTLAVQLLPLSSNLGYAGGLNAGIRWAQQHWSSRSFWLLNNDVEAEPQALSALVAARRSVADAGVCGSVLLDWDRPQRIQAVAGIHRRYLGLGWHLRELPDGDISFALDYPVGASLYVEQDYLDRVGLMDDSYFLYSEEMDWVERGRRRGFRPLVALRSRLRHKEGASTGSRGGVRHQSLLSERYGVINRLRITRKFWPRYLPLVWLSLVLVVIDRLVHRELARALLVLRLMVSPSLWLR